MGNDISVGAVTNINVADISPHLSLLVDANTARPHGRVFTNLRCRYTRNLGPGASGAPSAKDSGVLDAIGVPDAEIRWEDGSALSVKVFLRSFEDAQEARQIKRAIERAVAVDKTIRSKLANAAAAANGGGASSSFSSFCRPISVLHQEVFRVTERAIWMARPWVQHSVLQRVLMRPYCSVHRRLFFAYQLLRALAQLHEVCGLAHGDIKCENVLVDSHGWVYVADISSFYKPTLLPAFDPEVFEKCFNTGVKSSCAIAPERFVDKEHVEEDPFKEPPTASADIFSAASVIVSLLNDLACFLTLSDVLKLRELMMSNDPAQAERFYREKIASAVSSGGASHMDAAVVDMLAEMALGQFGSGNSNNNNGGSDKEAKSPANSKTRMKVERLTAMQIVTKYTPSVFPKSFALLYDDVFPTLLCLSPDLRCHVLLKNLRAIVDKIIEMDCDAETAATIDTSFFSSEQEVTVTLEEAMRVKTLSKTLRRQAPTLCAAFECLSSIIVQCIRRSLLEQSLLVGLSLIARAAPLFPDATLRDPLLPLVVTILQSTIDTTDTVRAFALDALVFVCAALGSHLSPSNAFTFEDYVLPALCECGTAFGRSPACMVTLARVLPIAYLLCSEVAERREAMGPSFQSGYGYFGLRTITVEKVWDTMKRLINSSHTAVVVTSLRSLPPLLPHLSIDIVVGQVLPMLTLWFNSPYVELRREMFRIMFEVVWSCGPAQQVLATVGLDLAVGKEDDVLCIASVLEGLRNALLRKCFSKSKALEYVKKTAFLITHSSREVARAAANVIEAAATTLDPIELSVFVFGPIAPFLRSPVPVKELVRRNYDIIRPMCRVPDPTNVIIVEGSEYANTWCRDLAVMDVAAPPATPVITPAEVERAAQILRESGTDIDSFFCMRLTSSSSSSSQSPNSPNRTNANSPWIMFHQRHGKLIPKLVSRQQQRLNEIALAEASLEESSPWWSSTRPVTTGSFVQVAGARASVFGGSSTVASQASNNLVAGTKGTRRTQTLMGTMTANSGNQNTTATTAGISASGGGFGAAGGFIAKPPKPTGVSVASHSEAHRGGVRCMVAQMQFLATGGGDGSVRVWDTEDAILGAGYLDERARSIFTSQSGEEGARSPLLAPVQGTNSPTTPTNAVAITALHFLGQQAGHTLIVGNEAGNASVYNVVGEAAESIPWPAKAASNSSNINLGGIVTICAPGASESLIFLGLAGGIVGAVDLRSTSANPVWTAKTPAASGPLVEFAFASRDKFWSAVSVNRGGLVALWDLRMRAIVGSADVPNMPGGNNNGMGSSFSNRPVSITCACICEHFQTSPIPSVAIATDTGGVHRYDLASLRETLQMRPTTMGSVRAMTSLGGTLYTAGTDSLLRSWDMTYPDRSFTVSRGLEPSPPYSLTGPNIVAEALPAAVDMVTMGGWIDIADNRVAVGDESNGSPLHSDGITALAIVSVTPSAAANWGNRSFTKQAQAALEPDQLHVCTGSRDGSVALWRNSE